MGMKPEQYLARFGAPLHVADSLWSQEPSMWGVEVGITPARLKRWRDRPRHTLLREADCQ